MKRSETLSLHLRAVIYLTPIIIGVAWLMPVTHNWVMDAYYWIVAQ